MLARFLGTLKRRVEDNEEDSSRNVRQRVSTSENKRPSLELNAENGSILSTQNSMVRGINAVTSIAYNQLGSTYSGPVTAKTVHLGNVTNIYHANSNHDGVQGERTSQLKTDRVLKDWSRRLRYDLMDRRRDELSNTLVAPGTCQWLFETEVFHKWETNAFSKDGNVPVLALEGKPGSGKSIILKTAFSRSLSEDFTQDQITLGFFFNARDGMPLERSSRGFYRGLLSQLLDSIQPVSEVHTVLDKLTQPRDGEWDTNILKHTILEILRLVRDQRVFLFLDALDECQDGDDNGMSDVIDILEFIHLLSETSCNVRVLLSTRNVADIEPFLTPTNTIDVRLHNQHDIQAYLEAELKRTRFRPDFRSKLISMMSRRAGNMFLWARLVLIRIKQRRFSEKEIMMEVETTPKELQGLYKSLIETAALEKKEESLLFIQLIQSAVRPLTLLEVQAALAQGQGVEEELSAGLQDLTTDDFSHRIHTLSGGLLEITASPAVSDHSVEGKQRPPVIQFIHHSVIEYLRSGGLAHFDSKLEYNSEAYSHLCAAKLCMKTLGTPEAALLADSEETTRPLEESFLPYASQFWTLHARKGDKVLDSTFDPPSSMLWCSTRTQVLFRLFQNHRNTRYYANKDDIPDHGHLKCSFDGEKCIASSDVESCQESLLFLLAYEGCTNLVIRHAQECPKRSKCHENKHILERAFLFAVHRGWTETARSLLNLANVKGITIDVNMSHLHNFTPLYMACFKGKIEMVNFLLDQGADPLIGSDKPYELPLHAAIAQGYLAVVCLLLERFGDKLLSKKDSSNWTVLHQAAEVGHVLILGEVLKHLKAHNLGGMIHDKTDGEETALEIANAVMEELRETQGPLSALKQKGLRQAILMIGEFMSAME